ncbi:protein kinase [Streptomyces sp. NPDC051976]|uniref:protein kinase domain-containing protein n=1 Tax=Streptomyces sp. NPDC051976 TaxID=3154947 RepID=UPI003434F0DC
MEQSTVLADRYELVERIGRGGMGTVHRAVDHRLRRTVAVKTLSAGMAAHGEFRSRFQREAHAAAALNHPAVATVHDVGEELDGADPVLFLVMEYVDGTTLAELVRRGPLPVQQAVNVVCEVLDALAHSHEHGIVHRDIKPGNVMLTRAGTAKVLDFGIAKALSEAATRVTSTGVAVGTPAYLSPEQINGADIDPRCDVYAVGCLLHELLTGAPPFTGESPFVVMHQHLAKDPVPPSQRDPRLPAALDPVILRALSKDRADRFPNAAAMRLALTEALGGTAAAETRTAVGHATAPPTPPASSPGVPRGLRPSLRPLLSFDGAIGILGCLLAVLSARSHTIEVHHFARVSLLAAAMGTAALFWSPRLACALGWAPVAEVIATQSELRRAYVGWDTDIALIALLLALSAALCLTSSLRTAPGGAVAMVAFWLTGTAALWFFLDDLDKIAAFYALILVVTLATCAQEVKDRARRAPSPAARSGAGRTG